MGGSHNTEVEVRRRFNDPASRKKAMEDFYLMMEWLDKNSPHETVLMCRIEENEIVWKFGGTWSWQNANAVEFNKLFE
jgi:hypothetical protein